MRETKIWSMHLSMTVCRELCALCKNLASRSMEVLSKQVNMDQLTGTGEGGSLSYLPATRAKYCLLDGTRS